MKKLALFCMSVSVLLACRSNQDSNAAADETASATSASTSTSTSTTAMEQPNTLTDAEKAAGWTLLFDGNKPVEHWRGYQKDELPEAWQVEDGTLTLSGKGGDIITKEEYEDFELMLDWKIAEGGNSGIFFHVAEDPKYNTVWQTGPEMQILDDERHPDAKQGKNGNRTAGSNYDLIPPSAKVVKPAGTDFNTVRLKVEDGNVEQWVNGTKVVEYKLGSPEWEAMVKNSKFASMPDYGRAGKGHIALQDHGDKVWFRNIKIRRL
jgi:hypothetical protein